jgi:hypothetical protein
MPGCGRSTLIGRLAEIQELCIDIPAKLIYNTSSQTTILQSFPSVGIFHQISSSLPSSLTTDTWTMPSVTLPFR